MIFINFILNFFRNKFSNDTNICLDEILDVYNQLDRQGNDEARVVFRPKKARKNEIDILHIQFSIREGKIGLDWTLQNSFNISQQAVFLAAAKSLVYPVKTIEEKGGKWLRIEGEKSALICRQLLANLYAINGNKTIKLESHGFNWTRNK